MSLLITSLVAVPVFVKISSIVQSKGTCHSKCIETEEVWMWSVPDYHCLSIHIYLEVIFQLEFFLQ